MGSIQELVLTLLLMKREQIEHARLRALAQIQIDPKQGMTAFEEYMKLAFPWAETVKKRETAAHMKLLEAEIKKGPLAVTAARDETKKMRSRLKAKVVERTEFNKTKEEAGRLYSSLPSLRRR